MGFERIRDLVAPLTIGDAREYERYLQSLPFERVRAQRMLTPNEREKLLVEAREESAGITLASFAGMRAMSSTDGLSRFIWLSMQKVTPRIPESEALALVEWGESADILDGLLKLNGLRKEVEAPDEGN